MLFNKPHVPHLIVTAILAITSPIAYSQTDTARHNWIESVQKPSIRQSADNDNGIQQAIALETPASTKAKVAAEITPLDAGPFEEQALIDIRRTSLFALTDGRNVSRAAEIGCCETDIRSVHRSGLTGEFLYLQARGVDVPYAAPFDGIGLNAVPIGPTLFADPTYQPGFRIGLTSNRSDTSSLSVDYWFYQSQTNGSGQLDGGAGIFDALTVHPNTTSVATDSLQTSTNYDLDFDIIDAHYRTTFLERDLYTVDFTIGARYARIDQDFHAAYSILGTTDVNAELGFDGVGPRLGIEFDRPLDDQYHIFVNASGSLLVGHVTGEYTQTNAFSGTVATAALDDSRLVPVSELEIGLGWQSASGHWHLSASYYVGTYHNSLSAADFISGVQANSLHDLGDSITFDGLMARLEITW
jgi:hypothetical protein